jgi:hypothetical protein
MLAERFIQTLKVECLDRFLVFGTKHLDHLVAENTDYYNRQRPHSRAPRPGRHRSCRHLSGSRTGTPAC